MWGDKFLSKQSFAEVQMGVVGSAPQSKWSSHGGGFPAQREFMIAGFMCPDVKEQDNQCCRCSSNALVFVCYGVQGSHSPAPPPLLPSQLPMDNELLVLQVLLCSPFTSAEPLPKRT